MRDDASSEPTAADRFYQPRGKVIHNLRWYICALLFFAATINYLDRQVIGILKPTLQKEFGWTEIDFGNIVFWFQTAYAAGLLIIGRVMDWLGTRKGFSFAVIFWSLAAAGHALARGVTGFSIARFTLGIGESGNFPASIKTVAEWFPKNERALATGIFNSGTNIGVLAAAAMVPAITISYGWKWAFIVTGAIGFIWLAFWIALYHHPDQHPNLSAEERELIQSDPPDPEVRIPWLTLIRYPQTWAVAVGKFMTDPIWWVYLYWLPDFLNRNYSIDLKSVGLPLIAVYLISDVGSIAGGWLSSTLIKRGWTINRARKTAMLICAVSVTPIVFAGRASNVWVAVLLVGLAAAAHQGWSANIYTIASDMFPRRTIGSVIGFAGMCGAVGGMLIAKIVGYILEWTGSYVPIFIIAASAYLVALALVHTLSPRLEAARIGASSDPLP